MSKNLIVSEYKENCDRKIFVSNRNYKKAAPDISLFVPLDDILDAEEINDNTSVFVTKEENQEDYP